MGFLKNIGLGFVEDSWDAVFGDEGLLNEVTDSLTGKGARKSYEKRAKEYEKLLNEFWSIIKPSVVQAENVVQQQLAGKITPEIASAIAGFQRKQENLKKNLTGDLGITNTGLLSAINTLTNIESSKLASSLTQANQLNTALSMLGRGQSTTGMFAQPILSRGEMALQTDLLLPTFIYSLIGDVVGYYTGKNILK